MTAANYAPLAELLKPRTIAVIGATEKATWSQSILMCFKMYRFEGNVYAVNREGKDVFGVKGYASVRNIPEPVDAVYILVPVKAIKGALTDAISAGVKIAVILTSGFAETGSEGAALQDEIVTMAREGGLMLFGPNSLGFVNLAEKCPVSSLIPPGAILDGGVALVSQSGATTHELMTIAVRHRIGMSFIAATGNEAMIGLPDLIEFLVEHEPTKVIAVYAESISNAGRLRIAALRAAAAGKPVVILKVGSSEISVSVAAAHTGSMVGDDRVFDAACRDIGMIRVRTVEELMLTADFLASDAAPEKPGIGVISISGGACGMIADLAEPLGVELPAFSAETVKQLKEALPVYASSLNPLDVTGGVMGDPSIFTHAARIVGADPSIGAVYVVFPVPSSEHELRFNPFPAIGEGFAQAGKPCAVWTQSLQPVSDVAGKTLPEAGVPYVLNGLEHGLRAIASAVEWKRRRAHVLEAPTIAEASRAVVRGPRLAGERASLEYLATCGIDVIPAHLVNSMEAAATAAETFGGAVALKIASPDIAHKTEIGGVKLDVIGGRDAAAAYSEICAGVSNLRPDARVDGVIVSPMRKRGIELFVGVAKDSSWGPVLAVGLGGVWVEVLQDTVLSLLPASPERVMEMLNNLRGARLLQGYRGAKPADLDKLAQVISRIGDAALALGDDLAAFEINPLLVDGDSIEALDALAIYDDA